MPAKPKMCLEMKSSRFGQAAHPDETLERGIGLFRKIFPNTHFRTAEAFAKIMYAPWLSRETWCFEDFHKDFEALHHPINDQERREIRENLILYRLLIGVALIGSTYLYSAAGPSAAIVLLILARPFFHMAINVVSLAAGRSTLTKRKRLQIENEVSFDSACALIESTLKGNVREEIVDDLLKAKNFEDALLRLRGSMRSHVFRAGDNELHLDKLIRKFDNRTRDDGFHILQDWDGKADRLNKDTIVVDVVNYFMTTLSGGQSQKNVLAILLDYYFMYLLALLAMRAWDEGNPNDNLQRLTQLLQDLQGSNGSGQGFAHTAETLILIATSHFEPDGTAYDRLLEKVKTLNDSHQVNVAQAHVAILASHLRFGFDYFYKRDLVCLRTDNVPDYPWLCFSVTALLTAYARMHDEGVHGVERDTAVEGILNGLTPDARAFVGKPPASLTHCHAQLSRFNDLFQRYRDDLLDEFQRHRPTEKVYSPLAFNFNFPHNIVKAMVVHALIQGEASALTLNDLLTGMHGSEQTAHSTEGLAKTLMGYARSSPEKTRSGVVPIIIYDPYAGVRTFAKTIAIIREHSTDEGAETTVPS